MSRLIVETGAEAGMVYPVADEAVTIGRSASSTVQIVDKRVSRHHAVLRHNRDSYVVEDLGSKNGTFLNDEPLVGRVKLNHGDRVQIGDTVLTFELDSDAPEAAMGSETTRSGTVRFIAEEIGMPVRREEKRIEITSGVGMSAGAVREPIDRDVLRDPFHRLQVLYQVADSLRAETDPDDLLRKIMDILWTTVAPYRGIILLVDEKDGGLEPVVVRTRDGHTQEINISRGIVERSMREQVAILVSDAPSDLRFSSNESVVASGIRSAICSPLVHKGEVLGVLYLDSQEAGTVYYTNDELELITGIANQAAMAITNARLHRQSIERQKLEKELEIAREIQTNLLPREYPRVEGVTFAAMSQPARQVGGDYYDFVPLGDGRTALVVADVSGKGVPAAILTATIRASIRLEAAHMGCGKPVADIVSAINQWTCRDATNNMFVTMVFVVYDPATREITYTNAGHCFPLLFKPDGEFRMLDTGGCFLGIMDVMEYESASFVVEEGDTLVLYTDGVTDAHNSDCQIFGNERLVEVIRANLDLSAEELRDELYEATLVFRGAQDQFDDLTILVAKF